MTEKKYIRNGKNITTIETGKIDTFRSLNLAKKESRKLQITADGALGRGSLRVAQQ